MSQENVELVRRIYDGWSKGDFGAGIQAYDANVTLVLRPEFADFGVFTGIEALGTYMRHFLEPWKVLTIEAVELREAGDTVLARVAQRGTGLSSGLSSEMNYFQLWTLRGGKVIRIESVSSEDEAIEAAGLSRHDG